MLVTKHLRESYLEITGMETTLNKTMRKDENSNSHDLF